MLKPFLFQLSHLSFVCLQFLVIPRVLRPKADFSSGEGCKCIESS